MTPELIPVMVPGTEVVEVETMVPLSDKSARFIASHYMAGVGRATAAEVIAFGQDHDKTERDMRSALSALCKQQVITRTGHGEYRWGHWVAEWQRVRKYS